jgi:hypothetical protein
MMFRLRKGPIGREEQVPVSEVHVCEGAACQQDAHHPTRVLHEQITLLVSRLDEQQRRWYVAVESNRVGHGGGVLMATITGLEEKTIRRGELLALLARPTSALARRSTDPLA